MDEFGDAVAVDHFSPAGSRQTRRDHLSHVLTARSLKDLRLAIKNLRAADLIESVYVGKKLTCPSDPKDEPFYVDGKQAALDDLGVPQMWDLPGGTGDNVRVADLEFGWYDHPDLNGLARQLTPRTRGVEVDGAGINVAHHGTQTMTVVAAQANGSGMTGILPDLEKLYLSGVNSVTDTDQVVQNTPWAVRSAADSLTRGDVLLIEVSMANGLPLELEDASVRQEIVRAIGLGVVVVAAAGNMSRELDQPLNAIHVGAGWKLSDGAGIDPNSNRGSGVDCFAWGQGVVCGIRGSATGSAGWGTFKDTSAAAAMVAAVVAGVQSVRVAAKKAPLSHEQIRVLLTAPDLISVGVQGIGGMPHAGRMCARALELS